MVDYDSSAKSYLAQNLNVIMSVWKMSQQDFAALIELNYPTFNNYIKGTAFPRVPTLLVISDVTGVPLDLFLRQLIPIHLIPERPIMGKAYVATVQGEGPVYRAQKPPLLDYSQLEKRLEALEVQLKTVLSRTKIADD